jgi:hypothetical protein
MDLNDIHAVVTMAPRTVSLVIGTTDVMGRVVDRLTAAEPLPLNGNPDGRAKAIGTLVLLAVRHGATSIEIIMDNGGTDG